MRRRTRSSAKRLEEEEEEVAPPVEEEAVEETPVEEDDAAEAEKEEEEKSPQPSPAEEDVADENKEETKDDDNHADDTSSPPEVDATADDSVEKKEEDGDGNDDGDAAPPPEDEEMKDAVDAMDESKDPLLLLEAEATAEAEAATEEEGDDAEEGATAPPVEEEAKEDEEMEEDGAAPEETVETPKKEDAASDEVKKEAADTTTIAPEVRLAASISNTATKKEKASKKPSLGPKCSCAKSNCLKLYCDCLKTGVFCNDECECNDCHNCQAHDEEERLVAIRKIYARKPLSLPRVLRERCLEGGWTPPDKPLKRTPGKKGGKGAKSTTKKKGKKSKHKKDGKGKKSKQKKKKISLYKRIPGALHDENDDVSSSSSSDSDDDEDAAPPPLPYTEEEYPQLKLDTQRDHSALVDSFQKPLFQPANASEPLRIAYSHHRASSSARRSAQLKKNRVVHEYNALREKLTRKKLELSLANDEVSSLAAKAGTWTRKVFDLELEEDCTWNRNYQKLCLYKEEHGRLPPTSKKCKDEEEKVLASWLDRIRGQKNQEDKEADNPTTNPPSDETSKEQPPAKKKRKTTKASSTKNSKKKYANDYPHRIECLTALGVVWEKHNENKWETMYQKLLVYKEEMGTLRFPTDEQCTATGDEELIALQKWVKGQVLHHRYGKKKKNNAEYTKKLLDIGFDFDKWYAKPG
eukprot:CAMPEP_0183702944 /NCGR_PEP_ID=MMETSP0737-20130205/874_1 /TAXON_ID=385413 /ORGANISM="Thalassiosira miniscula, Strain CCMP1093" /LENGTH=692 /DNA_ID=CAMNT_0025929633 /DNA_START=43 /DNA_END=2118 /DNA_ORIENTATION=-